MNFPSSAYWIQDPNSFMSPEPRIFKPFKHGCLMSLCFMIGATIAPVVGIVASIQAKCSFLPMLEAIGCTFSQVFAIVSNPLLIINETEQGLAIVVAGVPGAIGWMYSQYGLLFLMIGGAVVLIVLKIVR
jgi:hypothetical protein